MDAEEDGTWWIKALAQLARDGVAVLFGDCLDILRRIPQGTVDLVFADPPYNMSKRKGLRWAFSAHVTTQEAWDRFSDDAFFRFNVRWLGECLRLLKPSGSMFVCGSYHNIFQLGFILQSGYNARVLNDIIWFKPNAQPNITTRMFTQSTETLLWVAKQSGWKYNYREMKALNGGKQMRNKWDIPVTPRRERVGRHPTQKPLALVERCVRATTTAGDLILDPFVGSGTTLVVARMLQRKAIGIELNEAEYGPLIAHRLASVQVKFS